MAGSSLPVTWRLPELEVPLGRPWTEALVASRGDLEIFGFHALQVGLPEIDLILPPGPQPPAAPSGPTR